MNLKQALTFGLANFHADQYNPKMDDVVNFLIEFIDSREFSDIDENVSAEIRKVLLDLDLDEKMDAVLGKKIEEAVDEYDFDDDIESAVDNYDYSDKLDKAIADALESYDMSEEITEAVGDFEDWDEVLKDMDWSEVLKDFLESHGEEIDMDDLFSIAAAKAADKFVAAEVAMAKVELQKEIDRMNVISQRTFFGRLRWLLTGR